MFPGHISRPIFRLLLLAHSFPPIFPANVDHPYFPPTFPANYSSRSCLCVCALPSVWQDVLDPTYKEVLGDAYNGFFDMMKGKSADK
eukprot:1447397-Pleurochrysis_carterae.AAC.2